MSAQEFKVGDTVRGDDYARLPVGARAQYERASASIVKVAADRWVYRGEGVTDPSTCPRTITHLPDASEPEDKDDLYVGPEPLKESPRDVYPARPVRLTDRLGAILFDGMATVEWTSTGAIGTITPVKPARCTSVYMPAPRAFTLHWCEDAEGHAGDHEAGFTTWTDAEAYGTVEVLS